MKAQRSLKSSFDVKQKCELLQFKKECLFDRFTNACRLLNSLFVVNIESCVFPILVTCGNGFLFCKIHANACMNNKLKVFPFNLNTRICVKLHANACHYHISKFYTHVITRTVHALSTNTTRRLHAFYARVGAAIPLTGTVCMYLPWHLHVQYCAKRMKFT